MEPQSKQTSTSFWALLTIIGTILFACVYMALADIARAHGAGMTFSTTTPEGHAVDVDYSDYEIQAGRIGRFDFNLFADDARTKAVEFTDIWIRITKDTDTKSGRTFFAGAIAKQEYGGNGFSIVFPDGGAYTMSIRYSDANEGTLGETVAEAEFKIPVVYGEDENKFSFGIEFLVGLLAGLFAALLGLVPLHMRKKKV